MKNNFHSILSWLVVAIILTSLSNLFLVLNEGIGYVNGMRIDYLMPKFFLSDIFILGTIILAFTQTSFRTKTFKLLKKNIFIVLTFLAICLNSIIFAKVPLTGLYLSAKLIEMALLALALSHFANKLNKKIILISVYAAIFIQTVFGVSQFIYQHSVTPYQIFGESQFTQSTIGMARSTLFNQEKILAYGTTPHPNILAGSIVLFSLIILVLDKDAKLYKKILLLSNVVLILFLTQSVSGAVALLVGMLAITFQDQINKKHTLKRNIFALSIAGFFLVPILISITNLILPNNFSIFRRNELNFSALNMTLKQPIAGVGLGSFTANLEANLTSKELVRFLQPAHHLAVLWMAETGILGAILIIQIWLKRNTSLTSLSPVLLALVPIAALDHYVLTTQIGMIVTILFIVYISNKNIRS